MTWSIPNYNYIEVQLVNLSPSAFSVLLFIAKVTAAYQSYETLNWIHVTIKVYSPTAW